MLLAIDPGQVKCGWALVERDGRVVERGIWRRVDVLPSLASLAAQSGIEAIVLGNRTGHRGLLRELQENPFWQGRIELVEEDRSSEEARLRYVTVTARGWRKLIPRSLRCPTGPYDDYVAVILAERFLSTGTDPGEPGREPVLGRRT